MVRLWILYVLSVVVSLTSTASFASPLIDETTAERYGLTRSWFTQVQLDRSRDSIQSVTVVGNVPGIENGTPEYRKHETSNQAVVTISGKDHFLGLHGTNSSKAEYDRLIGQWLAARQSLLLVQTRRGVVQALNAETGATIWVNHVGSPDHPTTAVGASHSHVAVVNGSELYLYERPSGKFVWKRSVQSAPGAGPGLSADYVFVPTISGILEAYDLENPRRPAWKYNAFGRALVQPVVSKGSVSWPTDRGLFYVAAADQLRIRFRTETQDEIVSQPAHIPPFFYVGSLDGYLYKVEERKGTIAWRFSSGEPVVNRPLAVNGRIFVTAQHGGLYCVLGDAEIARQLDAADRRAAEDRGEKVSDQQHPHLAFEEGQQIWWSPDIVRLLAVTPKHVYGMDKVGRIRIVQTDTGSPVDMLQTEGISLSVINHTSDRIYIGTDAGLIQCLHEPDIIDPLSYVIEDPIKAAPPRSIKQSTVDEGPGESPFGEPVGEDPFGSGEDPFGAGGDVGDEDDDGPGPVDEDPFG